MNTKKNFAKFLEKKMFINVPKDKMSEEFRNIRKEENLSNVVNTSERRILFYKTKICPWYIKGKCERRKTCLYAHAQNELRELPNLCKTSLCPKLKINELCNDKKCKYAHTNIELRATENLYKTALCESFLKGKCFSGQFCRYAHGHNELRENPMEITDKNIIIGTSKNKNDKLDFEKKKNVSNNNNNNSGDICKRNETYCIFPKKKELYFSKLNTLTEDDGVYDITETMDTQVLNDSTTENSYECNKKAEFVFKNGNNNNNLPSPLEAFMKQDENSKFNEEQFLNDNLNVLGFLEEHNNVEKIGKTNNAINEINSNSNNFYNNMDVNFLRKNKDISNSTSSMMNFSIGSHGKVDMNTHNNLEDNYYNFNANNIDKLNYEDIFFSDNSFTTINSNGNRTQTLNNYMINESINGNVGGVDHINNHRNVNPNNSRNDNITNNKDMDNYVGWDNFSLFGKTKTLIPENDYFKIFNYGICNNVDNKIYDNCKVYKNQIDNKVDKSLFIL
ncbi:zinc finger protein, putative [Plasmodium relictum]|uniref:Zinc finger protein, putative n=1 Tax=Plasmodium relictum TaxID=85471 RepID=A0A1J1H6Q3_PLARL|nr:zinc finger protein, putative [Plasmodium relictum]CRG99275.1 zinc finger protein, putative [Plasmodium relictum]